VASYLDSIKEFDRYLQVERNLADRTRKAYQFDLEKFYEYLFRQNGRVPAVQHIDADTIRAYMSHLQLERGYKSTTLSRTISTLRVFFKFCLNRGFIKTNPTEGIHNPKHARKLPIYLVESELKKLLEAPQTEDPFELRDYAILMTLGFTGFRLQELVGINLNDVDFERQTIKVFGKGRKERIVPMNRMVQDALTQYIDHRPVTESKALFLNKFNNRLSGRSVENIVKKYVQRAGIYDKKISPHKLRHTFATLLHMKNVDILEIKDLLGHASITSTQIYTHTNPGRLRDAVTSLENINDS
jgi:site-specific recombinase XerD